MKLTWCRCGGRFGVPGFELPALTARAEDLDQIDDPEDPIER
jgi:hypothetical protein